MSKSTTRLPDHTGGNQQNPQTPHYAYHMYDLWIAASVVTDGAYIRTCTGAATGQPSLLQCRKRPSLNAYVSAVELQSCGVSRRYPPNPTAPLLIILATPTTTTPSPLNHRHQRPPLPPPLIAPSPALPAPRQSSRKVVYLRHFTIPNRFFSIVLFLVHPCLPD